MCTHRYIHTHTYPALYKYEKNREIRLRVKSKRWSEAKKGETKSMVDIWENYKQDGTYARN